MGGFTKVSRFQWAAARAMWESDPRISLVQIAESLGVSRQAAQKRANTDGWRKREDMEEVARQAHERADQKIEEDVAPSRPVPKPPEPKPVKSNAAVHTEPPSVVQKVKTLEANLRPVPSKNGSHGLGAALPDIPPSMPEEDARRVAHEAAVQRRAEVLTTHRKEWLAVRQLAYAAIKGKDDAAARHVKTCSESLKIIQDGERKAWGLDADEKKPPSVQVIINRRAGVTLAH